VIRLGENANAVTLDVIDSGPGIDADAHDRIFDRFFRAANAAGGTGAGLGLSIAKGAIEANAGRLTLVSSSEHGSVFRITLPRATARLKPDVTYARPA
jgi:signal transduction histidine kinase